MRTVAGLLVLVLQAGALEPGLMTGMGRVDQTANDRGFNTFYLLGFSLSHDIGFLQPYADAALGFIQPGDYIGQREGRMAVANLGLRATAPLAGLPFRMGAVGGMAWHGYAKDEAVGGDAVATIPKAVLQPFAGIFAAWRNRVYAEVDAYPSPGTDVPWALRFGIAPFAFFR